MFCDEDSNIYQVSKLFSIFVKILIILENLYLKRFISINILNTLLIYRSCFAYADFKTGRKGVLLKI